MATGVAQRGTLPQAPAIRFSFGEYARALTIYKSFESQIIIASFSSNPFVIVVPYQSIYIRDKNEICHTLLLLSNKSEEGGNLLKSLFHFFFFFFLADLVSTMAR